MPSEKKVNCSRLNADAKGLKLKNLITQWHSIMSKQNRILSLHLVLLFCFVKWYYLVSFRGLWTVDYWLKHGHEACSINCRHCYRILRHPKYPAVFATYSLGTLHMLQLLQHDPETHYISSTYHNRVLRHSTYLAVIATLSWGMLHPCSYCNIVTLIAIFSWGTPHMLQLQ